MFIKDNKPPYLFLTTTTYATWLPGDDREFVSAYGENVFGTPFQQSNPTLRKQMQRKLKGSPVYPIQNHAEVLAEQFQETARFCQSEILAFSIMPNHVHLLAELPDTVSEESFSRKIKSYGSRRLNETFGKPSSGTWWTHRSSLRRVGAERILRVVQYIREQKGALFVWVAKEYTE